MSEEKSLSIDDVCQSEDQCNYILCELLAYADYVCLATQSRQSNNTWKVDRMWQASPRVKIDRQKIVKLNQSRNALIKSLGVDCVTYNNIKILNVNQSLIGFDINICVILIGSVKIREVRQWDMFQLLVANAVMKMASLKLHQYHNAFVSNLAHKIRTPLNGILYMCPLLSETQLNPMQKQYASYITKASISLASVMSDTVDISKLVFNKMELKREVFSIHECIAEAQQLMAMDIDSKHIKMEVYIEPSVPSYIFCDYKRLRQILLILIENAVSFYPKDDGSGVIILRVSAIMTESYYSIEFAISDNGIGLTEEQQLNILDSFWLSLDNASLATREDYGSSGIGLAIAQKLAQLMGGDLWLGDCEVGKGSTFVFNIIAMEDQYPSYINNLSLRHIKGKHAMIVDQDSNTRIRFYSTLSKWGMKCTLVPSLNELLHIHLKSQPDIMFVNDNISEKSCDELISLIRKTAGCEFPIVLIQSIDNKCEDSKHAPNAVLIPPIDDKTLMKQTIDLLNGISQPPILTRDKNEVNILIAEDDDINRVVYEMMLPKLGYNHFVFATNGKDAYDEVADNPYKYQILLIDIRMPIMDGITLSKKIRELYDHILYKPSAMPFMIGVSAQPITDGDNLGDLKIYISKPIEIKKFEEAMRSAILYISDNYTHNELATVDESDYENSIAEEYNDDHYIDIPTPLASSHMFRPQSMPTLNPDEEDIDTDTEY